jgi:hypothetical protein
VDLNESGLLYKRMIVLSRCFISHALATGDDIGELADVVVTIRNQPPTEIYVLETPRNKF